MLRIGVIGCGYWGPNLIRNFSHLKDTQVVVCADLDEKRLAHMRTLYPGIETTLDYRQVVTRGDIDAVVVATPPETHCPISLEALRAGKHVFVEKPLAISPAEGASMVEEAARQKRVLLVGHTFVYTAAVNKIKEVIDSGELGDILYISTTRVNLGIFQENINVIWDLAPHDVSILNYVLGGMPESVSTQAGSYIRRNVEDVAFLTLRYPNRVLAHVHVSWLNPNKLRSTTVVGSRKMLVYDDVSALEKIRIYDKGVTVTPHYDTFGEFHLSYRYGDILIPKLDDAEPLKVACQHFVDCVQASKTARSSGLHGLEVVRVLDAAMASLRDNGRMIDVEPVAGAVPGKDPS
ncbi:MAG: Gfo/Idh/MocA family oxidoreductase [Candidatus Krumholzibacteria bacterium]|nr:Gfo/Idh/MocA family oxidoreductase [Candidatus Krumholzibacteria bacterium]MDH4336402.1 Gfo/Idh/MocA family oxidoreductase [Candidatus Krumholzibacteria bacterium]MDH5269527.1 Gfo/Idh/MocA family oxidoreductase [Candidatus Krumholzibacteria bacterium]MDH5627526.1 Gfo/Idh/MocA family oxidoreductase [Candidatus Krumholzibacteria bacterium]